MKYIAQATSNYSDGVTAIGDALERASSHSDTVFIVLASIVIAIPFIGLSSWVIYNHFKIVSEKDKLVERNNTQTREEISRVHKEKENTIIELYEQLKNISYEVMKSIEDSSKTLENVFDQSDVHYREIKNKLEKTAERFEQQIQTVERNIKEYVKERTDK